MSKTALAYQAHIEELADALGCRIIQEPGMAGMMYVEFGYVEGPTMEAQGHCPNVQSAYMVMLHELGHVLHGHTQGRPEQYNPFEVDIYNAVLAINGPQYYFDNGILRSEAEAWEWALNQRAKESLKEQTRRFMWGTCLGSYYAGGFQPSGTRYNFRNDNRLSNGNRHWVEFEYDQPDEYFYSIKERLLNE